MAFGKSIAAARQTIATAKPVVEEAGPMSAGDRFKLMREVMLRVFNQTSAIANAVRTNGSFALTILEDQTDPASRPIFIKGFREHFSVVDGDCVRHPIYGYVTAQNPPRFDPSAQIQLHELTGRIMELNIYCQKAEREGALSIALQSPVLPPLIDAILVGASHFAGFFENIACDETAAVDEDSADATDRRRLVIEQHRRLAEDRMLDPGRYDAYDTLRDWPYHGLEMLRDEHRGDGYINEVYFPADYMKPLLDYAAKTQRFVAADRSRVPGAAPTL